MREFDKLVRDKIPQLIREDGEHPVTTNVEGEELERRLRDKLVEEANEYHESGAPEELADVLEVIHAICDRTDVTFGRLEELREAKQDERGGFQDGVVLERIRD